MRDHAPPPTAPTLLGPASPASPLSPPFAGEESGFRSTRLADAEEKRSVRRAMAVGAWVWPLFFLVDLYLGLVVYPGSSHTLLRCAFYRLVAEVGIIGVFMLSREAKIKSRTLKIANALMCTLCSALISVMALEFGGPASPYIHGIALVILIEALAVPAPWRDTLWFAVPPVLSFPIVVAVAAQLRPDIAAAFVPPSQIALAFAHYSILLASAIIAAFSGQIGYNARVQLRKARRLGRYRLEARIGEGGMNEVWLAWDESLKRNVALKILRSGADTSPNALARFEREALAMSRLTSPNTVRVFDFGASDDGYSYIAMEYLAGADLQQLVRERGALAPQRAVAFAIQACRSLAEAHDAGIIHRDVKPANLYAARFGDEHDSLKVLDFGIARLVSGAVDATATQSVRGTPAYMPPECWSGGEADARSDVYALGATLYCLLTGHPPFVGNDAALLVRAHLLEAPAPPSASSSVPLPASLDALVLRCLEKAPDDRFDSARALEEALVAVASELPPWTGDEARTFWADRAREKEDRSSAVPSSVAR
ncbi:MAG TPA: serine/threonine-protein kinase [Labilithrix sp.]|nr:serine/threonine-protein kinase [Labilithrix sp.]